MTPDALGTQVRTLRRNSWYGGCIGDWRSSFTTGISTGDRHDGLEMAHRLVCPFGMESGGVCLDGLFHGLGLG